MSIVLSKKDAYVVIFKEYPDVVTVEQMSQMLGNQQQDHLLTFKNKQD